MIIYMIHEVYVHTDTSHNYQIFKKCNILAKNYRFIRIKTDHTGIMQSLFYVVNVLQQQFQQQSALGNV